MKRSKFIILLLLSSIGLSSCVKVNVQKEINDFDDKYASYLEQILKERDIENKTIVFPLSLYKPVKLEKYKKRKIHLFFIGTTYDFVKLFKVYNIPIVIDPNTISLDQKIIIPKFDGTFEDLCEFLSKTYGWYIRENDGVVYVSAKKDIVLPLVYVDKTVYPYLERYLNTTLSPKKMYLDPTLKILYLSLDANGMRKLPKTLKDYFDRYVALIKYNIIIFDSNIDTLKTLASQIQTYTKNAGINTANLPEISTNQLELSSNFALDKLTFNLVLRLEEKYSLAKTLTQTAIMLMNGENATFTITTNYYYLSEKTNETVKFEQLPLGWIFNLQGNYLPELKLVDTKIYIESSEKEGEQTVTVADSTYTFISSKKKTINLKIPMRPGYYYIISGLRSDSISYSKGLISKDFERQQKTIIFAIKPSVILYKPKFKINWM